MKNEACAVRSGNILRKIRKNHKYSPGEKGSVPHPVKVPAFPLQQRHKEGVDFVLLCVVAVLPRCLLVLL